MKIKRQQYDSPWKSAIEIFFHPMMELLFPDVWVSIDWTKGFQFLESELEQVLRDSKTGKRHVDKLVKVWLTDGHETWFLIHIEFQAQVDKTFPKRMCVYNSRIFDHYDLDVTSMAILGDSDRDWRPTEYHRGPRFGFKAGIEFPIVKLIDFDPDKILAQARENPVVVIVSAHLKSLLSRRSPNMRFRFKVELLKIVHKYNLDKEYFWELVRLLDWFLALPRNLEIRCREEIVQYCEKEGITMTHITSWERMAEEKGEKKGEQKGIQKGVMTITLRLFSRKFGSPTPSLERRIRSLSVEQLEELSELLLTFQNISEVKTWLADQSKKGRSMAHA